MELPDVFSIGIQVDKSADFTGTCGVKLTANIQNWEHLRGRFLSLFFNILSYNELRSSKKYH
jgi:hypothetical protein